MRPKRLVVCAGLCALLMWLSVGSTLNLQMSTVSPDLVAAWWPFSAQANISRATSLLVDGATAKQIGEARAQAVHAMMRQPVSAAAARLVGLSAALSTGYKTADPFLIEAERLSRRDLPTQLWLIQRAVESGDIPGALKHYDIALTTHANAADLLLPTLANASVNPPISAGLLPLLRRRPVWFNKYIETLITDVTDAPTLFRQVRGVGLDRNRDNELLAAAVAKLVLLKRPDLGLVLLGLSYDVTIRNGSFESDASILPFDWWLRDEQNLVAYRSSEVGGRGPTVLRISAKNEIGGEVAHQMLMLKPATYVLQGIISGNSDGQGNREENTLQMEVVCTGSNRRVATLPLAAGSNRHPFDIVFTTYQDCPSQWLRFSTTSSSTFDGWIDGLSITKVDELKR